MEKMETGREQQVWKRVFSPPVQAPREDLRMLQLTALELAAVYRNLAGVLSGKKKELARQLYEGELDNATCLKGMCIISGAGEHQLKLPDPPKEPVRRHLAKSYHRTRRIMEEYTARSLDGEFGTVFQKMAQREGEHCVLISQLLGLAEQ